MQVSLRKTYITYAKNMKPRLCVCVKTEMWTSLVVQWLRLCAPNARGPRSGPGLIPGQETRSHMPQLRVHMLQLKIAPATTEDPACCNEDPACGNEDLEQPNEKINIKMKN